MDARSSLSFINMLCAIVAMISASPVRSSYLSVNSSSFITEFSLEATSIASSLFPGLSKNVSNPWTFLFLFALAWILTNSFPFESFAIFVLSNNGMKTSSSLV